MTPLGVILVLGLLGSSPFPLFPFSLADDSYQVVFEDVGQVATSVSYLHLAVDLHFPEVKKALDDYLHIVQTTFPAIGTLNFPPLTPHLAVYGSLSFKTSLLIFLRSPHNSTHAMHTFFADTLTFLPFYPLLLRLRRKTIRLMTFGLNGLIVSNDFSRW